jgi:hypothetical protein
MSRHDWRTVSKDGVEWMRCAVCLEERLPGTTYVPDCRGYVAAATSPTFLIAAQECGTSPDNPDTCGVCHKHFAECEEEEYVVDDELGLQSDRPLHREPACPGARVRAALAARTLLSADEGGPKR